MKDRLFIGIYPGAIVYADTSREVNGDYATLASMNYRELILKLDPACPPDLARRIKAHAATIQARRGELFKISTCGQTVMLGES